MNKYFSYFQNILFLLGLSFCINIITWLVILTQIHPTSEIIPLHYNIYYGPDIVGKGYYLYLLPLVGLAILGINYFFYKYAKTREEFAAKTAVSVALVLQVLILISVLALKSIIVI